MILKRDRLCKILLWFFGGGGEIGPFAELTKEYFSESERINDWKRDKRGFGNIKRL